MCIYIYVHVTLAFLLRENSLKRIVTCDSDRKYPQSRCKVPFFPYVNIHLSLSRSWKTDNFPVVLKFVLAPSLSQYLHTHTTDNVCTYQQSGHLTRQATSLSQPPNSSPHNQEPTDTHIIRRLHNNNYPLVAGVHTPPFLSTPDRTLWFMRVYARNHSSLPPWHSVGLPASSESCRQFGLLSYCAHCPQHLKIVHTDARI